MPANTTQPAEFTVVLNAEERTTVLGLLQEALGETRVEVHRTHTPGYREEVLHQETVLRDLIKKLR